MCLALVNLVEEDIVRFALTLIKYIWSVWALSNDIEAEELVYLTFSKLGRELGSCLVRKEVENLLQRQDEGKKNEG